MLRSLTRITPRVGLPTTTMTRRVVAAAVQRRSLATEEKKAPSKDASSGYINFRFTSPTTTYYADKPVYMVQMSAVSGDMAALGGHQPSLVQLKPGVVVVSEEQSGTPKKFFVSGGFCVIKADNTAALTASEAVPLDDLDLAAAKQALTEQTTLVNSAPEGVQKVTAQVGQEVYNAMVYALETK